VSPSATSSMLRVFIRSFVLEVEQYEGEELEEEEEA
jgi:hypothetical protein